MRRSVATRETDAVSASDYRTRILDAAEACLVEQRMSAPLHARIAERAGLSRPTVYKYVGDQEQIFRAVLERLAAQYVEAVLPELSRPLPLLEKFSLLAGFSVEFFRASEVVAAIIRNEGDRFLAWLAEEFEQVVRDATRPLVPLMHEWLPATRSASLPVEEVLEWGVRITIALVFMPSATRSLDTAAEVEAYVRDFLRAFGTS